MQYGHTCSMVIIIGIHEKDLAVMSATELLSSRLFIGLETSEIEELILKSKPRTHLFIRDNILWHEDDIVNGIGLLKSGTLLSQRLHSDGRVQLVRLYRPNDIINAETAMSHKQTSPLRVLAASSGSYLWFQLGNLFENPLLDPKIVKQIQSNLLVYLADDAINYIKKADILSHRTIRERLLMYLEVLSETNRGVIDIGMTQMELAQFLNVDRSTLSEELNKMRREGLLDYKKRVFRIKYLDEN